MSSIDMERFRNDINRYRNKTGMLGPHWPKKQA